MQRLRRCRRISIGISSGWRLRPAAPRSGDLPAVLSTDLHVDYAKKPNVLRGVKLEVLPGEILGLVGQSGSGKSTLAMALMGLLGSREASVHGRIVLAGQEVVGLNDRQMREIRGRLVSLIPQSPSAALNPALRIGTQLREAWIAHALGWPVEGRDRVRILLASSGLPGDADFLSRFPSQISIGQAQRILIVMALLHNPALLIADEPTSALDLVTQREVLDLLARINLERRMAILFISHDLLTVSTICHRLAILHEGVVVECGPAAEILSAPQHWYTRQLVAAIPKWSGLAGAP